MIRGLLGASVALVLTACAAALVAPPAKLKPLAGYAGDPFVPVNLYMNANEHAVGRHAELIEYAAEQLRKSGAFVRMDRGVQRWPITLQARYSFSETEPGFKRVLSALTLGLVPVHVQQTHTLFVEVFAEPEQITALEYSETAQASVSVYARGERERVAREAVDRLLQRLLAELAQREAVPRWNAFKPEPIRKPKKPPGRPT